MPKLSIIIPVFNTEPYLPQCLESIIGQSFSDFELILVDDGSTDNCPTICDDYSQQDARVKVIHKKNEGVSVARNTGMKTAKGDYLTVVDSDDWLEKDMYQSMFQYINKYDADVVMCDCIKDYSDRSEVYTHDIRPGFYSYEQLLNEYYPHLLMMENVEYPATISNCLMIWKRSITSNNNIEYLNGVKYSEDLLFGAQIMSQAKSFYYMKEIPLYHYCVRESSSSHSYKSDKWNDYIRLYEHAKAFFSEKNITGIDHQINLMLLFFLYNCLGDLGSNNTIIKDKRKYANTLLNCDEVKLMFKIIRIYELPISVKLKILTYLYKYKIGLKLYWKLLDLKKIN